jgi:glycogen synthase
MPSIAADAPLKIALLSYAFAPGVGGIETVSQLLVTGLRARGHTVRVVTHMPAASGVPETDREILRRPSAGDLMSVLRWSDAVLQSNTSVGLAWPLVARVVRRPWVVINHTPIARINGEYSWRDKLKVASLAGARVYSVSKYLGSVTARPTGVMYNPYDADSFHLPPPGAMRDGELMFLGRVVRAKGLDVLVEALALLARDGFKPRLSIAGDGSERAGIEARIAELGLGPQVRWLGVLRGQALGDALRHHRVVVVPSRPQPPEALPLVPVEALACGCVLIAARQGGLPESVGPCGLLMPPEDPAALAAAVREVLTDEALQARLLAQRESHLAQFHPDTVIGRYEAALREAMR